MFFETALVTRPPASTIRSVAASLVSVGSVPVRTKVSPASGPSPGGGPSCEHNYTTGLLHYYYLTPMRREFLVIGKYLAGLSVALVLFVGSTGAAFLTLGAHFGPAWNDYLYQAVLLSVRNMTVSVMQGQLFSDTDAPWNAMMAAAIIYVLPPVALLFALRRYVMASLTMVSSGI